MEHTQKAKIFAELEDEGYIVRDNLSGYYIERKLITKKRGKFIAPLKILISKTYKYLLILLGWILKSLYDEIVPIIIEYIKNAMK